MQNAKCRMQTASQHSAFSILHSPIHAIIPSMSAVLEEPEIVVDDDVAAPPPARERLVALDAFRGLTIAGMLLVNNPGSWDATAPAAHALTAHATPRTPPSECRHSIQTSL